MSDFLKFISEMTGEIGLMPTLFIALIVALSGYFFKITSKKEAMLNNLIVRQIEHSERTYEVLKEIVTQTNEISRDSMNEMIRLSSRIETIVEMTKMLLREQKVQQDELKELKKGPKKDGGGE